MLLHISHIWLVHYVIVVQWYVSVVGNWVQFWILGKWRVLLILVLRLLSRRDTRGRLKVHVEQTLVELIHDCSSSCGVLLHLLLLVSWPVLLLRMRASVVHYVRRSVLQGILKLHIHSLLLIENKPEILAQFILIFLVLLLAKSIKPLRADIPQRRLNVAWARACIYWVLLNYPPFVVVIVRIMKVIEQVLVVYERVLSRLD